ncbi:adenosine receptor A2b-like [Asterias rubens]|uniref:adenosine receptor A2b-like n=1 Tax=Asterias rubens TaxID=7604 RepID=UPI001454F1B9|nr:adenosine receptor A2b-like [Asterias rubens]
MSWEANSTNLPHLNIKLSEEIAYMFRLTEKPYMFGFCVVLDLVTILLQGFTCYVFWCGGSRLSYPTTRLLFNQSFAELCVVLGHALNILAPSPVDLLPPTIASEALCRLWLSRFLLWGLYSVALHSLLLSSFERYLATVHPIKHRTSFGTSQATTGIAIVWVYGFAWSSVLIAYTTINPETGLCHTSEGPVAIPFGIVLSLCGVSLPAMLLMFFFFSIFWRLRKTSLKKGKIHGAVFRKAKINTLVSMAIVCTNYHLMFIPTYVICFFKIFTVLEDPGPVIDISLRMCVVMPIICVFCNPWIFYFKNPGFRYAFKKAYLSVRKKFKNEVDVVA